MGDLYVRVNREGIRDAMKGDQTAMPISVHDEQGRWIHRTRRLGIRLGGKLEVGYLTFDRTLAKANAAGVYLLLPNAVLVGDDVHVEPPAREVAELVLATGALTAEQIFALSGGYQPPAG